LNYAKYISVLYGCFNPIYQKKRVFSISLYMFVKNQIAILFSFCFGMIIG